MTPANSSVSGANSSPGQPSTNRTGELVLLLQSVNRMSKADAAVHYRRLGLPVIPIAPKSAAHPNPKRPRIANWTQARWSEAQVRAHWQQHPNDNIGILCGVADPGFRSVHVLDLDKKPGRDGKPAKNGGQSLKLITTDAERAALQRGACQTTAGGGGHCLLIPSEVLAPYGKVTNLGAHGGIDYLASGCYFMVAPSEIDGKRYEWVSQGALALCPPSLVAAITTHRGEAKAQSTSRIQVPAQLTPVDLDAECLPIDLKDLIRTGDTGAFEGKRHKAVGFVVFHLYRLGVADAKILSILTDREFGISDKALEEREDDRRSAAEWIAQYQLSAAKQSIGSARFNPLSRFGTDLTLSPIPEYPIDALPALLSGYAHDISERIGTPIEFVASTGLAIISGIMARHYVVRPLVNDKSWRIVPILWSMNIGPPASGKSPAQSALMTPLYELEAKFSEDYKLASAHHESQLEFEYKCKKAQAAGVKRLLEAGDTDGAERLHRSNGATHVDAPTRQRVLVADWTVEALQDRMYENQETCLIAHRDELIGLLAGLAEEERANERAFLLTAFDGTAPYTIDRIKRGTLHIRHPRVAIIGNVTPGKLLPVLTNIAGGDGLWQRFQLMAWPDRTATLGIDRVPDETLAAAWLRFVTELYYLSVQVRTADHIFDQTTTFPLCLDFDNEAQQLFREIRTELHLRTDAEKHEGLRGHLGKFAAFVAKLAAIIHVCQSHPKLDLVIRRDELERAVRLARAYLAHAERAYRAAEQPQHLAMTIVRNLPILGPSFTARDVYTRGWAGLSTQEQAQRALDVLVVHGYLLRDTSAGKQGGRPTVRYVVHPLIAEELGINHPASAAARDFAHLRQRA